jgi:hypothetical protein
MVPLQKHQSLGGQTNFSIEPGPLGSPGTGENEDPEEEPDKGDQDGEKDMLEKVKAAMDAINDGQIWRSTRSPRPRTSSGWPAPASWGIQVWAGHVGRMCGGAALGSRACSGAGLSQHLRCTPELLTRLAVKIAPLSTDMQYDIMFVEPADIHAGHCRLLAAPWKPTCYKHRHFPAAWLDTAKMHPCLRIFPRASG